MRFDVRVEDIEVQRRIDELRRAEKDSAPSVVPPAAARRKFKLWQYCVMFVVLLFINLFVKPLFRAH
jgi:hypothetical protein